MDTTVDIHPHQEPQEPPLQQEAPVLTILHPHTTPTPTLKETLSWPITEMVSTTIIISMAKQLQTHIGKKNLHLMGESSQESPPSP